MRGLWGIIGSKLGFGAHLVRSRVYMTQSWSGPAALA